MLLFDEVWYAGWELCVDELARYNSHGSRTLAC